MKKVVLTGALALVGALAVALGPDVLGLVRLQQFVTASAQADQADGGAWPRLTDACMACHGVKGNSLNQGYPSLAAQPAPYIAAQLRNLASGQRANPNMGPLAKSLAPRDIERLAVYYSHQPAEKNRFFKADPPLRARGEQLVKNGACVACHGAKLMGHDQFPRLAGQGDDYLLEQLNAFANGTRSEASGTMKNLSAAMSEQDRAAVAHYLASVEPSPE